jgi:hypothetical protein
MATGTMTKVPESQVRDLDHRGAPRVCRTLRHQLFKLNKGENFEGFSYSDGLLAEPEQVGEGPDTHVRIDRCHGHPTILPTNPEPSTFDLRGGLLSWDAVTLPVEPLYPEEEAADAHGTLRSYRLSSHQRRAWSLPRLPLTFSFEGRNGHTVGVRGYSAHTDYDVFWIAAQTLRCGTYGGCGTETSYVYDAPLK